MSEAEGGPGEPNAAEQSAEDPVDEAIPSTSTYEDDETATRAEVDPDPEVLRSRDDGDRPVAWRPGRRDPSPGEDTPGSP